MYNVTTIGGEILNLDGALELDAANKLASEIEAEYNIDVRVVVTDGEESAIESSEAYNTGFEAAAQGEPRSANPYAKGTWDSNAWFAGWDAQ